MKVATLQAALLLLVLQVSTTHAFHAPSTIRTHRTAATTIPSTRRRSSPPTILDVAKFLTRSTTSLQIASTTDDDSSSTPETKKATTPAEATTPTEATTPAKPEKNAGKTLQDLRKEGGIFTISTPIGALNPFALYYGLLSIFLGIPWYISLKTCQFLYFITRGKFDPKRRLPVFFSHVWGTTLMRLSRSFPEIENAEILQKLYAKKQPAMFVANHNSWMDIPFLGATVGWRNYKLVSKKELAIIPILGTAIRVGGNIMIDRTDRRSQIKTLKDGISYLKNDGIHLCTFPEGTRSRTGRLLPFKLGAFKMAYKAGAPVVPISIVGSGKVMPPGWMFAMKPSYKNAKVVVHEPVETEGRTEDEVAQEVRRRMIEGLPEDQKPLL